MRRPGSRSGPNRHAGDRPEVRTRAAGRLPGMGQRLVASSRTPQEVTTRRRAAEAGRGRTPPSARRRSELDRCHLGRLDRCVRCHYTTSSPNHRARVPWAMFVRRSPCQCSPSAAARSVVVGLLLSQSHRSVTFPARARRAVASAPDSIGRRPLAAAGRTKSVRQWSSSAIFAGRRPGSRRWTRPRAGTPRRGADVGPGGSLRPGPAVARLAGTHRFGGMECDLEVMSEQSC